MQVLLVEMSLIWGVVVTSWCLPGSLSLDEYAQVTPTTFAWPFTPTSSLLTVCVRLHSPKMPLRSISSNTRKGQFGVLRCHTSPSLPVLSSRVHHVPKLCPRTSCPPSHTLPALLSAPHPLSLCLVCLPSQLLSKKRGLFRIHAGRKQRYPRQRACARGTIKPNL